MPFIKDASFRPDFFLKNRHVNTLYRYLFSKIKVNYSRTRFQTSDNDFIDLDFSSVNSKQIAILIHGLEGSSNSNYIHTMADTLNKNNVDIVAFNMRGCSGEPNNLLSSYHSGKTSDLLEIIQFLETNYLYNKIHIIGYSLGGNLTIKFMGEFANSMPKSIVSAVGVSAPCDLKGSSQSISKSENKLYLKNFLKTLKKKSIDKALKFPESNLKIDKIKRLTTFYDFDNMITGPINGFKDAEDYWTKSSCKQFIKDIVLPTLLIAAIDDPFLDKACHPIEEASKSKNFTFIQTQYGGHLGFVSGFRMRKQRWMENKILAFINNPN